MVNQPGKVPQLDDGMPLLLVLGVCLPFRDGEVLVAILRQEISEHCAVLFRKEVAIYVNARE
jgi:hypothetical protein